MKSVINVLIVEDHLTVRKGLIQLLNTRRSLKFNFTEVDNANDALFQLHTNDFDIVLLDIRLPDKDGIDLAVDILKKLPETRILFFTTHTEEYILRKAQSSGAHGILTKACTAEELLNAITTIISGGNYFISIAELNKSKLVLKDDENKTADLTPMERKILKLMIDGLSTELIANRLSLSIRTVQNHRYRINKKAKSSNRYTVFKYAISQGIV